MSAQTTLIYGPSGAGKTTQAFRLVKYLLEKERKINPNAKARLIACDGGGYTPFIQSGYVDKGLVRVFDIRQQENMLATMKRLADGYWPVKRNGQLIFNREEPACRPNWIDIPILIIEGMTSIAGALINHLSDQDVGQGFKFSYVVKDDDYQIGGLQEGHYGIVQKAIAQFITKGFNAIPCKYIIWTALRIKAEDKTSHETILGPEVVGSAMTHRVTSLLGSTFYLEQAIKDEIRYIKAHFESGIDASLNMPFVAKCRIIEDAYPILKEKFKNGYVVCVAGKQGIEKYFQVEEEILQELYG